MANPDVFPGPEHFEAAGGELLIDPALRAHAAELRLTLPPELGVSVERLTRGNLELRVQAGACGVSPSAGQGYAIHVALSGVAIESWTRAGVRYGLETLHQWLAASARGLPCGVVHDAPAFATRGVMLDVSRCRIPTMPEFSRIINQLAACKCNHLQLYTEHTFAYSFGEAVWGGWSPITPAELREIDRLCRERGIELAANQNCFGHLKRWLETPDFASLAETHGDWMFDVWPRNGPFSLCPTDSASVAFVGRMLEELTPCVRSPLVNIGCDETYDIAFGRSKEACDARGRGRVFAEFAAEIAGAAARLGKRPMIWGDIALSHPECLEILPNDIVALAWGYEPTSAFDEWGSALAKSGREFWMCPGTSSWRSLTGRTTERNGSIDAAVAAGVRHGASGVMICDWGDTGHWQQWPVAINALAAGLGAAWTGRAVRELDVEARSRVVFGAQSGGLARELDVLGDVDLALREVCGPLSHPSRTRLLNQSAMFIDLFKGADEQTAVGDVASWDRSLDKLRTAAKQLEEAGRCAEPLERKEIAHTVAMADFALRRAIARRFPFAGKRIGHAEWRGLKAEHQRLWRVRSREGGLAQSCEFFDLVESKLGVMEVDR